MSTLAERYAQFQQANLAAQQQALQTGQQQQINYAKDASGNVTYSYSPTGAPATPPAGSAPSPIGQIDRGGGGGGGSSGATGSRTIIDVGNELQAKQEQEQAARQAAAQNRSQGPQPGTVEYYRQQIEQSQVAAEQRRMAQQTITVQHAPEYTGPFMRTYPGPAGFDPFKNANFEYDEAGKVKSVNVGPQSDIGFDAKGTVRLEEKDGQQYALYVPTEQEQRRFYGYTESLTLPGAVAQTLRYEAFQEAGKAAQQQALATGKSVTLTADKINEQILSMFKQGGKYEAGLPVKPSAKEQGEGLDLMYAAFKANAIVEAANKGQVSAYGLSDADVKVLNKYDASAPQNQWLSVEGATNVKSQAQRIQELPGQIIGGQQEQQQQLQRQQAANERWASQVQNADWSAAYPAPRVGMKPSSPFNYELRNAAGFFGSMQIVGQYGPQSAGKGQDPFVKDAPAPTPGPFGPAIDFGKGIAAEAENLVKGLAYSAQGVTALFSPRQVPRRTLDEAGNELSSNMPKAPELKPGAATDTTGLAITSAFQLATTGKTAVQASDFQKVGANFVANPFYNVGSLALEALTFIGPGLITKGARAAQVGSSIARVEEVAAMAAKRVGYQESAVQALGRAEIPLTRGPLGTFWRPLWESGRVVYPKLDVVGEAATLAAGKAPLKGPTLPEAFAIRAGADVTAQEIGRILPREGEVRIVTAPLSEEQKIALRGLEPPKVGMGPPAPRTLQPGELVAKNIEDFSEKGFTGAVAGKILGTDAKIATEAADVSMQKGPVSITGKTPELGEFGLDLAEQLPQRTVRGSPLIPVTGNAPNYSVVTFNIKQVRTAAEALAKHTSQIEGAREALKDLSARGSKDMRPFDFAPAAETTNIAKTSLTPLERADAFNFDASLQEEASKTAEKSLSNALGAAAAAVAVGMSAFTGSAAFASGSSETEETITDLAQVVAFPPPSSSRGQPSMDEIFTNRVQTNLAKIVDNKPSQAVEQARKASEKMIDALTAAQNAKGGERQQSTQALIGNLTLAGETDLDRALRKNMREMMIEQQGLGQLRTPTEVSQQFLRTVTNTRVSLDTGTLLRQTPVQTPAALFKFQQQLIPHFDVPNRPPPGRPRQPDILPFWMPGFETTGKDARGSRRERTSYFEREWDVQDILGLTFGTKQAKKLPGYKFDDWDLSGFLPGGKKNNRSKGRRR